MSMQVCCVDPAKQQFVLPPSDIEKMRTELTKIDKFTKEIDAGNATEDTFKNLKIAIEVTNEIILSVDNSNDFFKIGGFNQLLPLLACKDAGVVAAAAELVADLCQNNEFCQSKMLDFNVMPELVKLIDTHSDSKVCFKALYALSCLCRHNEDALQQLEITSFLPVLLKLIQMPDERLRTKTAFFLAYLASREYFREALYQSDIIGILIKLLRSEHDTSFEHLLSALEAQVAHHKQSRIQCRKEENNLKQILRAKIAVYESNSACDEAKQHCTKILELCFHD